MKKKILTIAVSLVCLVAVLLPVLFYGRVDGTGADTQAESGLNTSLITGYTDDRADVQTNDTFDYDYKDTKQYSVNDPFVVKYTDQNGIKKEIALTGDQTAYLRSDNSAFGGNHGEAINLLGKWGMDKHSTGEDPYGGKAYRYLNLVGNADSTSSWHITAESGMICVLNGWDQKANNGNGFVRALNGKAGIFTNVTTSAFHVKNGGILVLLNLHLGDADTSNQYNPDAWGNTTRIQTDHGLITVEDGGVLIVKNCDLYAYENANKYTHTGGNNTGTEGIIGGFVGELHGTAVFDNCAVFGKVGNEGLKYVDSTETVCVAAFVGRAMGGSRLELSNCINKAQLLGQNPAGAAFVGGVGDDLDVTGYVPNTTTRATVIITNCYNNFTQKTGGSYNQTGTDNTKDFNTFVATGRDQASFIARIFNGDVTIKNCTNDTSFKNINGRSAGFVGEMLHGKLRFENCVNNGDITLDAKDDESILTDYAGGFVGYAGNGCIGITLENCANHGDITINNVSMSENIPENILGGYQHYLGGFLANTGALANLEYLQAEDPTATQDDLNEIHAAYTSGFTNCYNTGKVTNNSTTNEFAAKLTAQGYNLDYATRKMCVGGFVGALTRSVVTMDRCENQGAVSGGVKSTSTPGEAVSATELSSMRVGGFFGDVWASTKTICATPIINKAAVSGSACTGGIIGYLDGTHQADKQNFINTGKVTSRYNAGGIIGLVVGDANNFNFTDQRLINTADVVAEYYAAGGVIGRALAIGAEGGSDITCTVTGDVNVYNNGNVTAPDLAGGFIGGLKAPAGTNLLNELILTNCQSGTGTVTATAVGGGAGGIIGASEIPLKIYNSTNQATVKAQGKNGHAGGIVGYITKVKGSTTALIENCTNTGAVIADGSDASSGGIVGNAARALTIQNCTNRGEVSATLNNGIGAPGGILGTSDSSDKVIVAECTNEGEITGYFVAGGIVGALQSEATNGTVLDYYVDVEVIRCVNNAHVKIQQATESANVNYNYPYAAGGIVGMLFNEAKLTVEDCVNNGPVSADRWRKSGDTTNGWRDNAAVAGGILGVKIHDDKTYTYDGSQITTAGVLITGSVNTGDITCGECPNISHKHLGGIVGCFDEGNALYWENATQIVSCRNYGTIGNTGYERCVGGMIGGMGWYGSAKLTACANYGSVILINDSVSDPATGGMLGFADYRSQIAFDQCLNMGEVRSSNNNVGGIIGQINSGKFKISNTLNAGHIYKTGSGSTGGFIGYAGSEEGHATCAKTGSIENCANIGQIESYVQNRIAGIVGGPCVPKLTNCYSYGPITAHNEKNSVGYFAGNVNSNDGNNNGSSNLHYLDGIITGNTPSNDNAAILPVASQILDNNATALNTLNRLFGEGKMDLEFISDSVGGKSGMISVSTPFMRGVQVTEASGGTVKVRFIATVETLNLQRVGFTVTNKNTGESFDASAKYVFTDNGDLSARDPFCGFYMYMLNYWDVPATGTVTFEITPYTMQQNADLSNTYYLGDTYIITITDGALADFYRKTDSPVQTP